MNKEFYSHFHPDEHTFVDRSWDWIERAEQGHTAKLTDFLDPRQIWIVSTLVHRTTDTAVRFDGGYGDAERKRALIAPEYRNLEDEDLGIRVLSVSSADDKITSLDHGDYMGAILGLGIKRDKIGDIHVLERGCHCLVTDDIGDFLRIHLSQVHRVHVVTEMLPADRLIPAKTEYEEMNVSVASMRLDGIVSDVCRLSRAKVLQPIKSGRCRVNWKVEEDPGKPLKEGDMVSFQGFGRFKVMEVEGVSKKGRIRVRVGKFK